VIKRSKPDSSTAEICIKISRNVIQFFCSLSFE